MRLPRTARIWCSGSVRRFRPSNSTSPPAIRPGGEGMRRMIDRFVTDFPEPDSPTIPSVSPRATSKLTPSTARTVLSSSEKYVRSSFTDRRGAAAIRTSALPHLGIERIAQAIAEKIQREQRNRHRDSRTDQLPREQRDVLNAVRRQAAPRRERRLHSEPQKRQEGLEQHDRRNRQRRIDDHRPERVGHEVARNDL